MDKPTVDKEAILKSRLSDLAYKMPASYFDRCLEAMESYSASLLKENEELKKGITNTAKQLLSELQSKAEYWKQRCEAAEKLIHGEAYIHWPKELSEWRRIKHYESNPGQLKNQDI